MWVWARDLARCWLAAGIADGPVFRAVTRGDRLARTGRGLSADMIYRIVGRYEVIHHGQRRRAATHDLRRTYARALYRAGMGMSREALQANLGHTHWDVTRRYIGPLDAEARVPGDIYGMGEDAWRLAGPLLPPQD